MKKTGKCTAKNCAMAKKRLAGGARSKNCQISDQHPTKNIFDKYGRDDTGRYIKRPSSAREEISMMGYGQEMH